MGRQINKEKAKEMNEFARQFYKSAEGDDIVCVHGQQIPRRTLAKQDRELTKATDPVTGSTDGYHYVSYGAEIFSTINQEHKVWGALPQVPFKERGFPLITADETTGSGVDSGGDNINDDKPDISDVYLDLKYEQSRYASDEISKIYAKSNGRNLDSILRNYFKKRHPKMLNEHLMRNLDSYASVWDNEILPIDQVVSSYNEANNNGSITNTDINIYNVTKGGGATIYDAAVDHGSGSNRAFSLSLVDEMIDTVEDAGANTGNMLFLTSRGTRTEWSRHLQGNQRFGEATKVFKATVNGIVEERGGVPGGFNLATYQDIPILTSSDAPTDGIGKIFLLDLDDIQIEIGRPTKWTETSDPNATGDINKQVEVSTIAELRVHDFGKHGKIRDLTTA